MMKSHSKLLAAGARVPRTVFISARNLFENLKFQEAIDLLSENLDSAVVVGEAENSVQIYDCWLLLAQSYFWAGNITAAKEVYSWVNKSKNVREDCWERWLLGCIISLVDGHFQHSCQSLSEWIDFSIANNDFDISEPLLHRGYSLLRLGKIGEALEDFENGYSIARLKRSRRLQVEYSNFIGTIFQIKSKYRRAIEWYTRSQSIGLELESPTRIGRPALNIGICHYRLGDYEEAARSLAEALTILDQAGDGLSVCRTHIAMGNVRRLRREFDKARQHLSRAYGMTDELDCLREQGLALEFLGDVHRDEGKFKEALRYYQRGMAIAQSLAAEGDLACELIRREGETWIKDGQAGKGLEILARGLQLARQLGDRFEEGVILRCLAEGFLQAGDHASALDYSLKAVALLDEIDARHEHAIARLTAAEILLHASRVDEQQEPRDLLDRAWDHSIIAQGLILKLDIDHWTDAVKRLQARIMKRRQEEQKFQAGAVLLAGKGGKRSGRKEPAAPQVVIAESRSMKEVLQATQAYAPYDETVLLTGETGTGKELIAQLLHQQSKRRDRKLVTVNITAIPESTFERELFGHARGAYSGAESDGIGLAAAADGGTLFLDEIGELPLTMQVKLLRLLQDGSYMRLGDPTERVADLRIIAATNKELRTAVENGEFREDLYYRLCGLVIHIPAVRERTEDILPLLDHYLGCCEKRAVSASQYFNEVSLRLMARYAWPGNVREIIQLARRACVCKQRYGHVDLVLGDGEDSIALTGPGQRAMAAMAGGQDLPSLSRAHLLLALEECGGNRTDAARMLGVSRSAIYRRLKKLGLD